MIKPDKKKEGAYNNIFFMLRFILKNAPFMLIGNLIGNLLSTLPWAVANVVLLRYVIDVFTQGVETQRVYYACAFFLLLVVIGNILNTIFYEVVIPISREKINKKLYNNIYEKAARMDLACYDNPDYYNDFILAMNSMQDRVESLVNAFRFLVVEIASIATVVTVFLTIDPVLMIFVIICVLLMLPLGKKIAKLEVSRQEAMSPIDKKSLYYRRVFYLADYAKELRLNPAGEMIERRYENSVKDRLNTVKYYLTRIWVLCYFQDSFPSTIIVYLVAALYMGYKALVLKNVTTGDFVAAINGLMTVSSSLFSILTWANKWLREDGMFIGKYRSFMEAEETIKSGDRDDVISSPVKIEIKNVSFTYPGSDSPTLKNINMTINPYERVALVGYNGAGKTTLTNLLLRLYDVTEGEILIDGVNIKQWSLDAYHKSFAAVFQDYALFGATVGENVAMDNAYNKAKVLQAISNSGLDKELKNGADTVLLKEFDDDGQSLSGGESQKIAIARAFYKKCAFAILDEPSANLDPKSEYALNEAMARAASDKTVIFISHRLSTTVMADKIYMLENGEIVEQGNHDELIAKNGKYAYMFRLQADRYNSEPNSNK